MDSGLNSGVGFKHIDFLSVFQCLWAIGFTLDDSEVDSGVNSGVGFKNVDFPLVFQGFWAATAAGTARAQKSGTARRTPQGRIQESFFPLEEPYSETLLGNKRFATALPPFL